MNYLFKLFGKCQSFIYKFQNNGKEIEELVGWNWQKVQRKRRGKFKSKWIQILTKKTLKCLKVLCFKCIFAILVIKCFETCKWQMIVSCFGIQLFWRPKIRTKNRQQFGQFPIPNLIILNYECKKQSEVFLLNSHRLSYDSLKDFGN